MKLDSRDEIFAASLLTMPGGFAGGLLMYWLFNELLILQLYSIWFCLAVILMVAFYPGRS